MRETFITLLGHRFTYQDAIQMLLAMLLWDLILIWHDKYESYRLAIEMALGHRLMP